MTTALMVGASPAQNLLPLLRKGSARTKAAIVAVLAGMTATAAWAFTAPEDGDLGFAIYDTVVNNIVEGPIGLMAAILAFGFGAFSLIQGRYLGGIMAVIAGVALVTAEAVVTSLGFLV